MPQSITNIRHAEWQEQRNDRGELWRYLDLSGEHLGVRVEALAPGATSSVHHYHTLEEEHVLAIEGTATLVLGDQAHDLEAGDHVWFPAGRAQPHHIENRSSDQFRFLVFGERRRGDVVVYPDHQVMLVKALGPKAVDYTERPEQRGPRP